MRRGGGRAGAGAQVEAAEAAGEWYAACRRPTD